MFTRNRKGRRHHRIFQIVALTLSAALFGSFCCSCSAFHKSRPVNAIPCKVVETEFNLEAMPNMVIFIADDLRFDTWNDPVFQSPNIDSLSASGVTFTSNFVTNSLCAPSRCSLFTGLYPHAYGHRILDNQLRPGEENLLKILKDSGYAVVLAGKNDLLNPAAFDQSVTEYISLKKIGIGLIKDAIKEKPLKEKFEIIRLTLDLLRGKHTILDPDARKIARIVGSVWESPFPEDNRFYRSFYLGERDSAQGDYEKKLTEAVNRYLDDPPRKPFCLVVAFSLPHTPYTVEEPYFSMYDRSAITAPIPPVLADKPHFMQEIHTRYGLDALSEEDFREIRATYYGMASKLDDLVGSVLNKLKEKGLYDDSMITFISDNGDYVGDYGLTEKWSTGYQDCLLHMPLIIKLPGNAHAATTLNQLVQSIDVFPTIMEVAGIHTPYVHSGKSLLPLITGKQDIHREAVFALQGYNPEDFSQHESHAGFVVDPDHIYYEKIRLGMEDPSTEARSAMIRTSQWKLVVRTAGREELYNLVSDPRELTNLIDNPEYAETALKLRLDLLDFFLHTSDHLHWDRKRNMY